MRNVVWLPIVLAFACTKHNPEACCSTADQCSTYGLSGITSCAGTQVCNSTGACVAPQCTTNTDCTDPTMPLCVNQLCVAPQCSTNTDCTDPTAPFCENNVCVAACGSDADCMGMAGRPNCATSGECVACETDAMCTTATAPVCDGSAFACRGCVADSECSSGICLESNGTCADASTAVFVSANGQDTGTCTQASPCLTFGYAQGQMSGAKNVLKLLGNQYSVTGTVQVGISGYVDGTSTVITGSGSDGMFEIKFGNVVFTGVTLAASDGHEADVIGGEATFYGDTIGGTIISNGGSLTIDNAVAGIVYCGMAFNETTGVASTLNVSRSLLVEVATGLCAVSLQQSTIDLSSMPDYTGAAVSLGNTGSGASFDVENNVIVAPNPNVFGAELSGSAGDRFRFNTLVNLSGQDEMGEPMNCYGGPYDISNNIVAWHSSLEIGCALSYSLVDSFEALPPGTGNQVGDASTFFVDLANKDFHLAAGSPALHAAAPGVDVMVDHDGSARPEPANTNDDVGAYESPM